MKHPRKPGGYWHGSVTATRATELLAVVALTPGESNSLSHKIHSARHC